MGTHPIFESDFDCLTEKKMNRLLGRRMTMTPQLSGNVPKRTEPAFSITWKHPGPGVGRQHMLNSECQTDASLNQWRALVVKGRLGPKIGTFLVSIRFFVWGVFFFSVPFLSLGHNAYKRYGAPNA